MPDTRLLIFLIPFSTLLAFAMYYGGWQALKDWLAKLETPLQVSELDTCAPPVYCTRIVPGNPWGNAVQFEFNEPPQHAIIYRTSTHENRREEHVEIHVPWRKSLALSFINGMLVRCRTVQGKQETVVYPSTTDVPIALAFLERVRTIAARPWK